MAKGEALLALLAEGKPKKVSPGGLSGMSSDEEDEAGESYARDVNAGDAAFDAFAAAFKAGNMPKAKMALKRYVHACMEKEEPDGTMTEE